MTEELKPCPFCGETYIIQGTFKFRGDGRDRFPNDIVCSGCGTGYCGHDFKGQGEAAVVAAWNRRADTTEIDRLRNVLADTVKAIEANRAATHAFAQNGATQYYFAFDESERAVMRQIEIALATLGDAHG